MSTMTPSDDQERGQRQELIDQMQRLAQTASTETALFHQAAAATYGLGITDMKTLSILMQEGPMTAGEIAARLSLTTGAVTSVIDRLERKDFAQRQTDATDRRKVIVSANPHVASRVNVYQSVAKAFAELLHTYSTEELVFLARYFQDSIELSKQEIARLAQRAQQK